MYDTGGRVQEIIDLKPSMVRLKGPFTVRLLGKGNKTRMIPVMSAQTVHLEQYIKVFNLDNEKAQLGPLFFNSRKEKLTRAGVTYILKKYAKQANEQSSNIIPSKISCHTLRHSKAMHLLQEGVPLIYIRDILGHVSVKTTEIYARADTKHKRKAIEKAYINLSPNETPEWEEEGSNNLMSWLKKF